VNEISDEAITLVEQSGLDQHTAPFTKPQLEGFETPERLKMTLQYLQENGVTKDIFTLKTPHAECEDALLAHSPYLVHSVQLMSELGSGQLGESAYASENLLSSALYALGGALLTSELILSSSTRHAFALIRPPGHHATTSSPMGLCFFNNVAVAVKNILQEDGIDRVSIIDIDDHFGNGTAEIFYHDPSVQFVSLHEYNYASFGLGHYKEVGQGEGTGTNVNIPLWEGSPDSSYQTAFSRIVLPAIEGFNPDVIAVSAGYDAHYADPLGDLAVDSRTYWFIADSVNRLVRSLNLRGSFWVLEGGYNPLMLGPCIRATLDGLQGKQMPILEDQGKRKVDGDIVKKNKGIINRILKTVAPFF
jgi:acetoin utilization deacetylase AcuC-like enzyme